MKFRIIIFIVILINSSCNTRQKEAKTDRTKYYTTGDTLTIYTENADTLKYSKQEFNEIVDSFPELYSGVVQHPDINYYGNPNLNQFRSEVGQDEYYILYAYFLKKQTGEKRYTKQRATLIEIYNDINSIFGQLSYGGTYFGHQTNRIIGDAEYSIYQYQGNEDYFIKLYDIKKEKQLYMALLRQKIVDEVSVDNEIPQKDEKAKRQRDLFKYVKHLDSLITNNFYLKMAEEFQFSNY